MKLSTEQLSILRLFRSQNVGPVTFKKLMLKFGDAETAIQNFDQLNKQYKKKFSAPSIADIQKEVDGLHKIGGRFVFINTPEYPPLLEHINDAPPVISVLGNVQALQQNYVALVGNRSASGAAIKFTKQLSHDLVQQDIAIISGMARGVDTAAHEGCLNTQGTTIAVLAGGVDNIYPPENKSLYENIISNGGAIVSEMPLGLFPSQNHFPKRNRIVSGIAHAVAVIEAAKRSGSLITANLANEQNRDIYAMPCTPTDPRSEGPNYLLAEGAFILRSAQDILENTNFNKSNLPFNQQDETSPSLFDIQVTEPQTEEVLQQPQASATPADAVLAVLSATEIDIDNIVQITQLSAVDTSIALTELELMGQAKRTATGNYIKA